MFGCALGMLAPKMAPVNGLVSQLELGMFCSALGMLAPKMAAAKGL